MQAALQEGAAISRRPIPCACVRVPALWVCSRAVVGVASAGTSNSAARRYVVFIVIVRFLDCGPRVTGGTPEFVLGSRRCVSDRKTQLGVGKFPNTRIFGLQRLAASTNASDFPVDVLVFFIKHRLRYCRR